MWDKLKSKGLIVEIAIFLFGILIVYFGIYKGTLLLASSGEELGQKQQVLREWQVKQELVSNLNEKIKDSTLKEELALSFPVRKSTAELLSSLQSAAVKSGVNLISFAPASSTGGSPESEGAELNEGEEESSLVYRVASYETTLSVVGNYKQIYNYLASLEKIKQVMRVRNFELQKAGSDALTSNINLVVYYITQ